MSRRGRSGVQAVPTRWASMGGRAAGCVGTGEQQQGMASNRVSLHARPQVGGTRGSTWETATRRETLERCCFLPIRFDCWRAQLTAERGVLRWLFGHMSTSVQGRVRRVGYTDDHALGNDNALVSSARGAGVRTFALDVRQYL